MKVNFRNLQSYFNESERNTIIDFSKFLQKQLPLETRIMISFDEDRKGQMTTGVRLPNNKIIILVKDRLLIDILRTLSHEWVHEYQHQKMGVKDTQPIQDIGGPEENMANVLSGIFIKKFTKAFSHYKNVMFGDLN